MYLYHLPKLFRVIVLFHRVGNFSVERELTSIILFRQLYTLNSTINSQLNSKGKTADHLQGWIILNECNLRSWHKYPQTKDTQLLSFLHKKTKTSRKKW